MFSGSAILGIKPLVCPPKPDTGGDAKVAPPLHHRQPSRAFYSPDLRNKKSRSTISRPDLLVELGKLSTQGFLQIISKPVERGPWLRMPQDAELAALFGYLEVAAAV
jgi:hypothetical protein